MDVGRFGDVMVVCDGICVMWLGFIQAWRYQSTFLWSYKLNLNQDNSDLPSQLSI